MTEVKIKTELRIRPLTALIGSEVTGVDLRTLSDATFAQIRRVFLERCVLVFRDQSLDPESQIAFTKRWGELQQHQGTYVVKALEGYPEVDVIRNVAKTQMEDGKVRAATEVWHADQTWEPRPPAHAVLAAQVLPEAGGDTVFANQYEAYDALSDRLKELLATLKVIHIHGRHDRAAWQSGTTADLPHAIWPIVSTHPETGRKCLYTSPYAVFRFDGMSLEESRGLLDFLVAHATEPQFSYRHRWMTGDVVMWDNRCTLHYAIHDYGAAARVLHRTSVIAPV